MHSTVGHLGMTSGQVSSNFVEAQGRTPHCERKKKKKKKDAIANMLFNVLLNVSLYMPSFRFESLFKNRYKNILFTDKKDKYLGY